MAFTITDYGRMQVDRAYFEMWWGKAVSDVEWKYVQKLDPQKLRRAVYPGCNGSARFPATTSEPGVPVTDGHKRKGGKTDS